MRIKFLADMNISPKTVKALQEFGWDIVRVSQFLPVNATVQEILGFALREDRVVITQDLDFSILLALGGYDSPSLITLRLAVSDPEIITNKLLEVIPIFEQELRKGCVLIVEDIAVRVRKLPIR